MDNKATAKTKKPVQKQATQTQATVYHSDSNDQRIANKKKNNKPRRNKNRNKSAQREQDFIDLLNKQ